MATVTAGTLYVVATPIGNLGDISARGREVLAGVDAICAEDTRHTRQLLSAYGLEKPLVALHEHNEAEIAWRLVERLRGGESLALVSDAGTPLVSDPGYRLVREVRSAGLKVSPVPGACAAIAALSVAGIPSDRFCFEGFLPLKKGRHTLLTQLAAEERTMVFYESPMRLVKTLEQFITYFGADRPCSVSRELTKKFEENKRGTLEEVCAYFREKGVKGEIVIVVGGSVSKKGMRESVDETEEDN